MITIIGTGHIFNLAEPVAFIIKHTWPDAVLVELDEMRFRAMTDPNIKTDEAPKAYAKAAEYQKKMAAENNTTSGAELIAAVNVGRTLGAEIGLIDINAAESLERVWKEMPFSERMRYRFSAFKDRFTSSNQTIEGSLEEFSVNEEKVIGDLRKRFPTFVRIIIDERNEHMAGKINDASERYGNIVVVIGDGHVEGVSKLLNSKEIKKIRLRELMNKERMDEIRSELWTHKTEEKE